MNLLSLDIRLSLETPLHTTGSRRAWGVDKAATRSADDRYVIPATSLKGALRASVEALLTSWGLPVCVAPQPATMCCDPQHLCLACQVFGNPRHKAPLKFGEARPLDEVNQHVRSGVSISRYRRAALPQRLFFIETVQAAPATEWAAKVTGSFATPQAAREAAALISLATRLRGTVGGGCSRGLGWVGGWRIQATLDGQTLSEDDLQPLWQAWSEGKAT